MSLPLKAMEFAKIYLEEKKLLLEVLDRADRNLWKIVYNLCEVR